MNIDKTEMIKNASAFDLMFNCTASFFDSVADLRVGSRFTSAVFSRVVGISEDRLSLVIFACLVGILIAWFVELTVLFPVFCLRLGSDFTTSILSDVPLGVGISEGSLYLVGTVKVWFIKLVVGLSVVGSKLGTDLTSSVFLSVTLNFCLAKDLLVIIACMVGFSANFGLVL